MGLMTGQTIKHRSRQQTLTGKTEDGTFITMTVGAYTFAKGFSYWLPKPNNHVLVGKYCSLARHLTLNVGRNHSYSRVTTYPLQLINKSLAQEIKMPYYKNPRQIIIGHDVWTGYDVTIMGGVKIGNGAVIGSNAVVAKDIPPYAIVVGNPARVIKYRFDEETIKKFLAVKWWNWDAKKISDNLPLMGDVEKFLETHYSPELEDFPEDDISRKLSAGGDIYHFIADFRAQNPLWSKVVSDFSESNFKNKVLVIWLGKNATDDDIKSLAEMIDSLDSAKEKILTFKHEENFSPAALRKGTHFITTREMTTLEALDYLWDTNVKIVSALDDKIFL